jgi:hypothetical protein
MCTESIFEEVHDQSSLRYATEADAFSEVARWALWSLQYASHLLTVASETDYGRQPKLFTVANELPISGM